MPDKLSVPSISLTAGPPNDKRTFSLQLPLLQKKLGILVSGGLDSALLYYLVVLLADDRYSVVPYTILRNDASHIHAQHIINYVNESLNKNKIDTTLIHIDEQDSEQQVAAGLREIIKFDSQKIYMGLIETSPLHTLYVPKQWTPINSIKYEFPFKNLMKYHIVDMILSLNQSKLFELTHSCVYHENRCGICNRCREREWAFSKLGLTDSGTI